MKLLGLGHQPGKKIKNYAYNYADVIGHGNFSKVYKGINAKTQQTVAIKIVSLDSLKSKHLEDLVFQQIKILQQINHPNILKFHEALLSERNCYIITELCNNGNLQDRIRKRIPFYEQQMAQIITDIYQGLKYLREMGVCHRDIKPANIFMNNGQAKIADFGLAKLYQQRFQDLDIGSPLYMSPEGLIQNVYGEKTDIWAFGILIYELIHGETPFSYCQSELDLKSTVCHPIPEHKFLRNIHPALRQLINSLLEIKQARRPSAGDLANDPYIRYAHSICYPGTRMENRQINNNNLISNAHRYNRTGMNFAPQDMNRPVSARSSSEQRGHSAEKVHEPSLHQKDHSKNGAKEERKLQVFSQSANFKIIELGGKKTNANNSRSFLQQQNRNKTSQPTTLIQQSKNMKPIGILQFKAGRMINNSLPNRPEYQSEVYDRTKQVKGRKGSGITADTNKEQEQDRYFLSREYNPSSQPRP